MIPDPLTVAASGVDYYVSEGRNFPTELTIEWFIGRHPCDDEPYLVGLSFPNDCWVQKWCKPEGS